MINFVCERCKVCLYLEDTPENKAWIRNKKICSLCSFKERNKIKIIRILERKLIYGAQEQWLKENDYVFELYELVNEEKYPDNSEYINFRSDFFEINDLNKKCFYKKKKSWLKRLYEKIMSVLLWKEN